MMSSTHNDEVEKLHSRLSSLSVKSNMHRDEEASSCSDYFGKEEVHDNTYDRTSVRDLEPVEELCETGGAFGELQSLSLTATGSLFWGSMSELESIPTRDFSMQSLKEELESRSSCSREKSYKIIYKPNPMGCAAWGDNYLLEVELLDSSDTAKHAAKMAEAEIRMGRDRMESMHEYLSILMVDSIVQKKLNAVQEDMLRKAHDQYSILFYAIRYDHFVGEDGLAESEFRKKHIADKECKYEKFCVPQILKNKTIYSLLSRVKYAIEERDEYFISRKTEGPVLRDKNLPKDFIIQYFLFVPARCFNNLIGKKNKNGRSINTEKAIDFGTSVILGKIKDCFVFDSETEFEALRQIYRSMV